MPRTRRFTPVAEWEDERQLLGIRGERLALAYLTACGWGIEAHRFKAGRHDVDLIVRKGNTVAFVEVKTRRSDTFGAPLEAVNRLKQRHIGRVAALWMLRHGRPNDHYRFDLVAVQDRREAEPIIEHVEDAWRLPSPWGY